ncbi:His-Xaa-Ser system radical SAM maturase HxsB [Pelomonas sp. Root1217]|nr:His-Xaa-Ser system radical SAM maturase HxsB [Pelomonas sp. Root1217]
MSHEALDAACDTVLQSSARLLTVEFQGGDPLLRFDLIERAVERVLASPELNGRRVRFVVASTLHQLTDGMCDFMARHDMVLSTSIDGPAELHNRNRPIPTRDSYERTLAGIGLARSRLGHDKVSALMTTTRESLAQPEVIVDEYVKLGFSEIFLRPLSAYGFAKRNQRHLGYSLEDFQRFYARAFERVLDWNSRGVALREVYASIILNKLLSPFDAGYVDLQSPCASGRGVLVYNYDGFVYPSDEARMVLESGDASWRMGRIGDPLSSLLNSDAARLIASAGDSHSAEGCRDCAYQPFCAPNPIDSQAQYGKPDASPLLTEHCQRHMWLFDNFIARVEDAEPQQLDMFHRWAGAAGAAA